MIAPADSRQTADGRGIGARILFSVLGGLALILALAMLRLDAARGVRPAIAVLESDAASPYAWSDAAVAFARSGDRAKARYCAARAFELGAGSAPLLMRLVHFYVGQGAPRDVLATARPLLGLVRDYDQFVFRYFDEMGARTEEVLERGLPPASGAAAAYLDCRIRADDAAGAAATWGWMRSHSLVTGPTVDAYVRFLIARKDIAASKAVWDEFHAKRRAAHAGNLVFNPDFEQPFLRGPYDWQLEDAPGAAVAVEEAAHENRRALRIEFRGEENIEFHHMSQLVAVPARPLRLTARVKCEGLTTNEGIAIRLFDPELPARFLFTSEQLQGTRDWKLFDYALRVPPATRLLELRLIRNRSQKLDNRIRGTAWFSEIAIRPEVSGQ